MDHVDPIKPLGLVSDSGHLFVAQTHKDGQRRQHEQEHEAPHDVIQLHEEEVVIEETIAPNSDEDPEIGLDIAV